MFSVPGLHVQCYVFSVSGIKCVLCCVFLVSGIMYVVSWSLGMRARSTWCLCLWTASLRPWSVRSFLKKIVLSSLRVTLTDILLTHPASQCGIPSQWSHCFKPHEYFFFFYRSWAEALAGFCWAHLFFLKQVLHPKLPSFMFLFVFPAFNTCNYAAVITPGTSAVILRFLMLN